MFTLHEQLARDTLDITRLGVSLVLLMKDRSFPWLILVPKREGVTEIHQLSPEDRGHLMEEIATVSQILETLFRPHKLNVGALGNRVPQLHVHVIARYRNDRAWPGPVWGSGPAVPYDEEELHELRQRLRVALGVA